MLAFDVVNCSLTLVSSYIKKLMLSIKESVTPPTSIPVPRGATYKDETLKVLKVLLGCNSFLLNGWKGG